jgi:hypothetical protein
MAQGTKIICTTCGAPFHALTQCPADAPVFVKAREACKAALQNSLAREARKAALQNILDNAEWVTHNARAGLGLGIAIQRGDEAENDARILMEIRHDLEDALKSLRELEQL